jgi:hypothetical protein
VSACVYRSIQMFAAAVGSQSLVLCDIFACTLVAALSWRLFVQATIVHVPTNMNCVSLRDVLRD